MINKVSFIFILLFVSIAAAAQNNYGEIWNNANNHYQQKSYDSAAILYQQLAKLEPHNTEVYYNLGNTHYKLNNIGEAVLNYERALKVDPNNKLASDNLYLTQSRINNRIQPLSQIFFVKWWHSITKSSMTNVYALIAAIIFLVTIIYMILSRLERISIAIPVQARIGALALCAIFLILSFIAANRLTSDAFAIVMTNDSQLMQEPKYSKALSLIPEGTKVEVLSNKDDWYEIKLPDGRAGWMQKASITKI